MLSDFNIESLAEDGGGNLWIGTDGGRRVYCRQDRGPHTVVLRDGFPAPESTAARRTCAANRQLSRERKVRSRVHGSSTKTRTYNPSVNALRFPVRGCSCNSRHLVQACLRQTTFRRMAPFYTALLLKAIRSVGSVAARTRKLRGIVPR